MKSQVLNFAGFIFKSSDNCFLRLEIFSFEEGKIISFPSIHRKAALIQSASIRLLGKDHIPGKPEISPIIFLLLYKAD